MRLGYLGPAGSHSQAAADIFVQRVIGRHEQSVLLMPMMSLTHILDAVEEGALDLGCVPVENALEGSVAEVLDSLALKSEKTRIIAEFVRPIAHALVRRYEFLEGIAYIHSHPQAIGQCREAVYALLGTQVKFVPEASTSEAVKALLTLDESHAALGSMQAAQHYGLDILVENIGNLNHNATRFLVISSNSQTATQCLNRSGEEPVKTSLCVGLQENKPGALLQILALLAEMSLNMTKIESRPTKKSLGEYLFYLDIEGVLSADAESRLREHTGFFKRLGEYPSLGVLSEEAV